MKTRINKSQIFIIALLGSAAVLISSCKKSDPQPIVYGDAKVRAVNTVAGSQPQDFYQADTKLSTTAIAYGTASANYFTVTGGPSSFSFKNTGTTTSTVAANGGFDGGGSYTVFYYVNGSNTATMAVAQDDNTAPAAGKAKVRFANFNFTPNTSLVIKSSASATPIVDNLSTSSTVYYTVDPGVDISATVIGAPTSAVILGSNFVAGKIYTIWFDAATANTVNYHIIAQN